MSIRPRPLAAALAFVILVTVGLAWFLPRGAGIVEQTRALQERLLVGPVTGRDRTSGVAQVTRNVDRMDREDVKKVRDAFMAEWRRLQKQSIEEFNAADAGDREALLDRDIDRLVTAGELWFATNPRSTGQPPKPRKTKQTVQKAGKPSDAAAAERFDTYRAALVGRAKQRFVALPEWLLDGSPR